MGFLQRHEEDIEKIKLFIAEITTEAEKAYLYLDEHYDPIGWCKKNPRIIAAAVVVLITISMYPLMSVWFLACIGTGYPAYKIIRSIMADRETIAVREAKEKEIREFLHSAIAEQKIVQIPLKQNSRIIQRPVIIRGEMEDGIAVKDPATGIQSKYAWDSIDFDAFYISYIRHP